MCNSQLAVMYSSLSAGAPHSPLACLAAATTASAVLNCEGAPARLLHLVADSNDADAMAQLVAQALAVVRPTTTPTFDEIKDVLNMVNCHLSSESTGCGGGSCMLACGSWLAAAPLLGHPKCSWCCLARIQEGTCWRVWGDPCSINGKRQSAPAGCQEA